MTRALAALLVVAALLVATLPGRAESVSAEQDLKSARVQASNGRWKEALVPLERALKAEPDYPDALYLAGLCHMALDQFDLAEKRLKRVTEIRPDFMPAWGQLSYLYVATKQNEKARQALGALGKVKGGAPESRYGFGVLAWVEGHLDLAEQEWREAIRLQPEMAKAHHNLGILFREKGDRARALAGLQDAVRINAENPLYRYNLGLLQMEMGTKIDGMANLDRVRSQTERQDLALLALATQMLFNNHPDQAEKAATRAYETNKELTTALLIRARALEALKRPDEARRIYEQALAEDGNLREARLALDRIPAPKPPDATPAPGASPAPDASPAPAASPTPDASPAPAASPAPDASPAPAPSPAPESSPAP